LNLESDEDIPPQWIGGSFGAIRDKLKSIFPEKFYKKLEERLDEELYDENESIDFEAEFEKLPKKDQDEIWLLMDKKARSILSERLNKKMNERLRAVVAREGKREKLSEYKKTEEYKGKQKEQRIKELNVLLRKHEKTMQDNPSGIMIPDWKKAQNEILALDSEFLESEENRIYNEVDGLLRIATRVKTVAERNRIIKDISEKYNKYLRYARVLPPDKNASLELRLTKLREAKRKFDAMNTKARK
jgi:hypothetical protein